MSQICLMFGQCGNQLGSQFIDTVYNNNTPKERWFHSSKRGDYAKCILVDTETKVVPELLSSNNKWKFNEENVITTSGGSGNNWAFGYNLNGPLLSERITEKLRQEIEKTDDFRSILCFLSSGGGTGSGVGTYIIEHLRDVFSKEYIVGNLVVPFSIGDSPIHLYNSILSLAKLNDSCDALVLFYNDFLFKQCLHLYRDAEFRFNELNSIISKQLCSLYHQYDEKTFVSDYLQDIVPLKTHKLLSLKSCPIVKGNLNLYETPVAWKTLIERLKAMLIKSNSDFWDYQSLGRVFSTTKQECCSYYKSLGNIVICNGKEAKKNQLQALKCFESDVLYSDWNVKGNRFGFLADDSQFYGHQFSTVATNCGIFNYKLDKIVETAWQAYMKNAYCHHYQEHGLEDQDFNRGFLKVENIVKLYNSL